MPACPPDTSQPHASRLGLKRTWKKGGVRRVPHPGDGTGSWAGGGGGLSHLVQGFQLQAVKAQLCLPLLFVHAAHGLTAGEVLEAAL